MGYKTIGKQLGEKVTTQNNCQSPSVWGSMQDLTQWVTLIMRKVREQPRTTLQEVVNDLKAAGTPVTKKPLVIH